MVPEDGEPLGRDMTYGTNREIPKAVPVPRPTGESEGAKQCVTLRQCFSGGRHG